MLKTNGIAAQRFPPPLIVINMEGREQGQPIIYFTPLRVRLRPGSAFPDEPSAFSRAPYPLTILRFFLLRFDNLLSQSINGRLFCIELPSERSSRGSQAFSR